jgi:hypothetical protein
LVQCLKPPVGVRVDYLAVLQQNAIEHDGPPIFGESSDLGVAVYLERVRMNTVGAPLIESTVV